LDTVIAGVRSLEVSFSPPLPFSSLSLSLPFSSLHAPSLSPLHTAACPGGARPRPSPLRGGARPRPGPLRGGTRPRLGPSVALAPAPPLPPGGARPAPCSLLRRRSSAPTWFTRPLLAPPRWPCPRHGGPAPRRGSRPLRTASRPSVWLAWPRRGLALPRLPLTRSRVRNPTRAVIILGF
jgi:hypothetical protein